MVAAQRVRDSLPRVVSDFPMEHCPYGQFCVKIGSPGPAGTGPLPSAGTEGISETPLVSSGNFSAGTHQGSHRSWHFHMVIHGTT